MHGHSHHSHVPRESVLKDNPIHIDTALQQRMARINAAKTAKPIRRLRSKKRIIVDILCGKCSLAKYYLHHDSNAIIICIDRRDKEDALSEIPRHMLARVRYVQLDAITLTYDALLDIIRSQCGGAGIKDVYHVHASPDCTTYSTAHSSVTSYRNEDGTVRSDMPRWRQTLARRHDKVMNTILSTIRTACTKNTLMLATLENPVGAFAMQPQVRAACEHSGFRLLKTHYCKAAIPRFDGAMPWTMKPTNILIKGAEPTLVLPQCNFDCPYRYPDTEDGPGRHRHAIRIDQKSATGQVKADGSMRYAIPRGLFHLIFESHERHLCVLEKNNGGMTVPCVVCQNTTATMTPRQVREVKREWLDLHCRYGHGSDKRLSSMKKLKGLIGGKVRCPTCVASKMCRKAHSGKLRRAAYALEEVSSDLQGPFQVPDVNGNRYQAIFVDSYTDRKWSYLLKKKSDYGEAFQLWLSHIQVAPQRMLTDGGGEFTGEAFDQFLGICRERNIYPIKTVPYSPELNSRAERANRTLLECTRTMLMHASLPNRYWGHAMRYAAHLDQFMDSRVTGKTPYFLWNGRSPDIPDPIEFGSALVFRHNEDRKKLDSPGHNGIYLGVAPDGVGHYVLDTDSNDKVRITTDISLQSVEPPSRIGTAVASASQHALLQSEAELYHGASQRGGVRDPSEPLAPPPGGGVLDGDRAQPPQSEPSDAPIPELDYSHETRRYWQAMQRYAQSMRERYRDSLPPAKIEHKIISQWKAAELGHAATRKAFLDDMQKLAEAQAAVVPPSQSAPPPAEAEPAAPVSGSAQAPTRQSTDDLAQPDNRNSAHDISGIPEDLPCAVCGDADSRASPHHKLSFMQCDLCHKGYHKGCVHLANPHPKSHGWACYDCIAPGTAIDVFWRADNRWHTGVVETKHAADIHTDDEKGIFERHRNVVSILYDDGAEGRCDLLNEKWRLRREDDMSRFVGSLTQATASKPVQVNVDMSRVPSGHREIMRMDPAVRAMWLNSESKELQAIIDKGAIQIVDIKNVPRDAVIIPSKWAYRIKACGSFKSRLCLLGNLMSKDDSDVSCPTPRLSSVRILMAEAIKNDLEFDIFDVDAAFLTAQARGTTYMRLPKGREGKGEVALLLKNLYGSVFAPKLFSNLLYNWFMVNGYESNSHDPCIYTKWEKEGHIHVLAHVDDLGAVGTRAQVDRFYAEISDKEKGFSITKAGPLGRPGGAERYLGIEVERTSAAFLLRNTTLIDGLIKRAEPYLRHVPAAAVPMKDERLSLADAEKDPKKRAMHQWDALPYRSFLGAIGYIMLSTRVDLAYAYKELARFNTSYTTKHWDALLKAVSYLKKTRSTPMMISSSGGMRIEAYCDADWNGSDTHLSTTGWVVLVGGSPVSWCSQVQKASARSVCESEYIALSHVAQEVVYLQMLLKSIRRPTDVVPIKISLGSKEDNPEGGALYQWRSYLREHGIHADTPQPTPKIWSDSQNAISNATTPFGWLSNKLRHIKTAFHFLKQYILPNDLDARISLEPVEQMATGTRDKSMALGFTRGDDNPADVLTKGFGEPKSANSARMTLFQRHARFCLGIPEAA